VTAAPRPQPGLRHSPDAAASPNKPRARAAEPPSAPRSRRAPRGSARYQLEGLPAAGTPMAGCSERELAMDTEESTTATLVSKEHSASDIASLPDDLPSLGSAQHASGECKRCCFFHRGRCANGRACAFCHFPHERRSRGRGCRGHGSSKGKAANAEIADAAAVAEFAIPGACCRPPPGLDLPPSPMPSPLAGACAWPSFVGAAPRLEALGDLDFQQAALAMVSPADSGLGASAWSTPSGAMHQPGALCSRAQVLELLSLSCTPSGSELGAAAPFEASPPSAWPAAALPSPPPEHSPKGVVFVADRDCSNPPSGLPCASPGGGFASSLLATSPAQMTTSTSASHEGLPPPPPRARVEALPRLLGRRAGLVDELPFKRGLASRPTAGVGGLGESLFTTPSTWAVGGWAPPNLSTFSEEYLAKAGPREPCKLQEMPADVAATH